METRWEREFSREELADWLAALAGQIRQGGLELAGLHQLLPPQAGVDLQLKEKQGRLVVKLRLSFSTLASYRPEQQQEVTARRESFKDVKKRLAASLAALKKAAAGGNLPAEVLLQAFLQDHAAFVRLAEPDWQAEMDSYAAHVDNLAEAHRVGNPQLFQHELADIQASMHRCHRESG